jgi:hypothetical protein
LFCKRLDDPHRESIFLHFGFAELADDGVQDGMLTVRV